MRFNLEFTLEAKKDLKNLKRHKNKKPILKAVVKTLKLLQENPRHPGLHTHPYRSIKGPKKEKIFEAYVQNNTPNAYRIFFCYGANNTIIIIAIIPHP